MLQRLSAVYSEGPVREVDAETVHQLTVQDCQVRLASVVEILFDAHQTDYLVCSSLIYVPHPLPSLHSKKKKKRLTPPRLNINTLDLSNPEHLAILKELGIVVESMPGGKIQVSHFMQKVCVETSSHFLPSICQRQLLFLFFCCPVDLCQ